MKIQFKYFAYNVTSWQNYTFLTFANICSYNKGYSHVTECYITWNLEYIPFISMPW